MILDRFALPPTPPPRLKDVDRALLAAEKVALITPGWEWPELLDVTPAGIEIDPWPPERGAREFLARFAELDGMR